MLNGTPSPDYYVMAVYCYVTSFKISEYGLGSAIAVVMVGVMALLSLFYVRQMVRLGEAE
jgi:ABC-type sugar transport system permease subunit